MVDSGRRHGPFDRRYPVRRKIAAPIWEFQRERDAAATLEWSSFVTRFFPYSRRHDFETLAAYEASRNAAASTSTSRAKRVIPTPPSSELLEWESEGGSVERYVG